MSERPDFVLNLSEVLELHDGEVGPEATSNEKFILLCGALLRRLAEQANLENITKGQEWRRLANNAIFSVPTNSGDYMLSIVLDNSFGFRDSNRDGDTDSVTKLLQEAQTGIHISILKIPDGYKDYHGYESNVQPLKEQFRTLPPSERIFWSTLVKKQDNLKEGELIINKLKPPLEAKEGTDSFNSSRNINVFTGGDGEGAEGLALTTLQEIVESLEAGDGRQRWADQKVIGQKAVEVSDE